MDEIYFGERIRQLRLAHSDYSSLRAFAGRVGLSPTYLSRIENGKEPPPSEPIIERLADALGVDRYELLSLAGRVPSEFYEAFQKNPRGVASFMRTASEVGLEKDGDWDRLEKQIRKIKKVEKPLK
jgi:transcriptional regulator with XRE-family HTH domain